MRPPVLYKEPSRCQELDLEASVLEFLIAAEQDGTWGCRSHFAAEDEGQSQMKPKCSVSKSKLLTPIPGTGKEEGMQGGEEAGDPCMQVHLPKQPQNGAHEAETGHRAIP